MRQTNFRCSPGASTAASVTPPGVSRSRTRRSDEDAFNASTRIFPARRRVLTSAALPRETPEAKTPVSSANSKSGFRSVTISSSAPGQRLRARASAPARSAAGSSAVQYGPTAVRSRPSETRRGSFPARISRTRRPGWADSRFSSSASPRERGDAPSVPSARIENELSSTTASAGNASFAMRNGAVAARASKIRASASRKNESGSRRNCRREPLSGVLSGRSHKKIAGTCFRTERR